MNKKALVLSGGGVKGAYQLGVLKKLMGEQGNDYEILTGVSVGALNVAGLSQVPYGQPREAINWLIKFWLDNVETKEIYKRWYPFGRLHSLWLPSVYDSEPLMNLVRTSFNQDLVLSSGRQVSVGVVSLDTGENKFVRETNPNFVDWVLASASYPVFLRPIKIDDQLWTDGGIKNVTPLGQAIAMGADEIDVIITSNIWKKNEWSSSSKRAIPDQVVRTLELMNDKIMQDDIKITSLKNDLAKFEDKYRHIKIRVVMPEESLGVNSLEFNPVEIRQMIERGYEDADKFLIYD